MKIRILALILLVQAPVMAAPDLICAELYGEGFDLDTVFRWGKISAGHPITAYSVGTISCNLGDQPINWIELSNQHPVIGQQLYRLKGGRFEQIGLSWVKHGFFALDEELCEPGECTAPPDSHPDFGRYLFPGCSDPYSNQLNGFRPRLGPRTPINASTGAFTFPFNTIGQSGSDVIFKRLQVNDVDIDPDLNPGALYFIEGQYISAVDCTAGMHHNNVSYRQVLVSENTPNVFTMAMTGTTTRETSAIEAWATNVPGVQLEQTLVDGVFMLGSRVVDLENGEYEYEYALYNQDSHRGAQSISIPLGDNVTVTNLGFHDVDYHGGDGDPFGSTNSATDWSPTVNASSVTWSTLPRTVMTNANALRWGTVYNFRFRSNGPPTQGIATVTLFRTGSPTSFTIAGQVPDDYIAPFVLGDMNASGTVEMTDVPLFVALLLDPANATSDHQLRGDMNEDTTNNATDISLFIDALIP